MTSSCKALEISSLVAFKSANNSSTRSVPQLVLGLIVAHQLRSLLVLIEFFTCGSFAAFLDN